MNKTYSLFAALACALAGIGLLSSCDLGGSSGKIWDIAPINIQFLVQDASGQNLAIGDSTGRIAGHKVIAIWRGETYGLDSLDTQWETRAYLATLTGLQTAEVYVAGKDVHSVQTVSGLVFGELDGTENYDDDLVIDWGDGTRDVFHIKNKFKWDWRGDPVINRKVTLNGKACESIPVFVK